MITFSLQSWTKADDISDFQIEDISIGDSILNHYSEEIIKKNYLDYYEPKYGGVEIIEKRGKYDSIQLMYKLSSNEYKIEAISALQFMDIDTCQSQIDSIAEELKDLFKSNKINIRKKNTFKHSYDKSGKSKVTSVEFIFKESKDVIIVACYFWSNKIKSNEGWRDNLRISVRKKEYDDSI